jgi:hypothetical protein
LVFEPLTVLCGILLNFNVFPQITQINADLKKADSVKVGFYRRKSAVSAGQSKLQYYYITDI